MTVDRYEVRPKNPDDTVQRPVIVDTTDDSIFSDEWALNDWDRARAFAAELNAIERGDDT